MKNKKITLLFLLTISIVLIFFSIYSDKKKVTKGKQDISNTIEEQKATKVVAQENVKSKKTNKKDNIKNINNKDKKEITEKPETTIKNEYGYKKIDDLTYKLSKRDDLQEIAVLVANELYGDKPDFGIDFSKAKGGEPIFVIDECNNSSYELVPLYTYNEYSGVVLAEYLNSNTVTIEVVTPSPSTQRNYSSGFKEEINYEDSDNNYDKFPIIDRENALSIIGEKIKLEDYKILYNNFVYPCSGKHPLSSPTVPFHSFYIDNEQYLVNSMNGKVITEQDMEEFEQENELQLKELDLIEENNKEQEEDI